jgi:hypothetical protein
VPVSRARRASRHSGQAFRAAGHEPDRMRVMLHSESDDLTPRPNEVPVIERSARMRAELHIERMDSTSAAR